MKRFFTGLLTLTICWFNQCSQNHDASTQFLREYQEILSTYQTGIKHKLTRDEIKGLVTTNQQALRELLIKYSQVPDSENVQLLRGKIYLALGETTHARESIQNLSQKENDSSLELNKINIFLLIEQKQIREAISQTNKLEKIQPADTDLLKIWIKIATKSDETSIQDYYAKKALASKFSPKDLHLFQSDLLTQLAENSCISKRFSAAQEYYKKAQGIALNPEEENFFKMRLEQLKLIGRSTKPLTPDTWLNLPSSTPAIIAQKPQIILFWSSWCPQSLDILNEMNEYFNPDQQTHDLITYTKLYGSFTENGKTMSQLEREDEVMMIGKFLESNHIQLTTGIDSDDDDFERFHINQFPVIITISDRGIIENIVDAMGCHHYLKQQLGNPAKR